MHGIGVRGSARTNLITICRSPPKPSHALSQGFVRRDAAGVAAPRARIVGPEGTTAEWRSETLPRYARRTWQLEALIAGV